jgi:hypothetical protein
MFQIRVFYSFKQLLNQRVSKKTLIKKSDSFKFRLLFSFRQAHINFDKEAQIKSS